MTEREPNSESQPPETPKIVLAYSGVESGNLFLNETVAEKFMQVADIRSTVVILDKHADRVLDYDELSEVKVGKVASVKHPGKDRGQYSSGRDKSKWLISIDGQMLARQTTDAISKRDEFSSAYATAFNKLVLEGLEQLLVNEKLLNSEYYNIDFLVAHFWTGLVAMQSTAIALAMTHMNAEELVKTGPIFAGLMGLMNFSMNTRFYLFSRYFKLKGKFKSFRDFNPNDPFVKKRLVDLAMTPVPLDRLARGYWYLKRNGDNLIQNADENQDTGS